MRRRDFVSLVGGAVVWPFAAKAAPVKGQYRLAVVGLFLRKGGMRGFFDDLSRAGFVEGKNLVAEFFSTEGYSERRLEVARDAVRGNPDAILVFSGPLTQQVKDVTATIPIACYTSDPIANGLATSLARPSANVTGVVNDAGIEGWGKKLQLLKEVAPKARRIGFLTRKAVWEGTETRAVVPTIRAAATALEIDLIGVPVASPNQEAEYRSAFEIIPTERIDGLLVQDSVENLANRKLIIDLVANAKIPAVYPYRAFAQAGGLVTYTPDQVELDKHIATQIIQILNGKSVQEIPWYQPRSFRLILNTKAASSIGIEFPPKLLGSADEVIE